MAPVDNTRKVLVFVKETNINNDGFQLFVLFTATANNLSEHFEKEKHKGPRCRFCENNQTANHFASLPKLYLQSDTSVWS